MPITGSITVAKNEEKAFRLFFILGTS
jgi:hypothetical protein